VVLERRRLHEGLLPRTPSRSLASLSRARRGWFGSSLGHPPIGDRIKGHELPRPLHLICLFSNGVVVEIILLIGLAKKDAAVRSRPNE